jgi:glucose-1-phosphate thymidylyltransferase
MIDAGEKVGTFPIERWYDCGTSEALLQANRALLDQTPRSSQHVPGSVIISPSAIAETAAVEGSILGPYVTVADGAKVVNAVIRDSIINSNARVENVLLEHSIIGDNAAVTGRRGRINLGDSSEIEIA